jgi:hypothetical protein
VAAAGLAREVNEAEPRILELDAECLELALIAIELAGERQRFALELFTAVVRLVGARRRRDKIELEDRLAPATMLLDDILDDLPNQRKRAVRLIDGEKLHT